MCAWVCEIEREIEIVVSYLGASSDGNDTGKEISNHRFQGGRHAIHMDSVDETQTVLFDRKRGNRGQTKTCHRAREIVFTLITRGTHKREAGTLALKNTRVPSPKRERRSFIDVN